MYCPKCSVKMGLGEDGLYFCEPGDMPLSPKLNEALISRFPGAESKSPAKKSGRLTGAWFCPGCASPLDAAYRCATCSQGIADLIHQLVELHPHSRF